MISLIIGIAIGAAFSPFWLWLYNIGKDFIESKMNKNK